MIPSDYYTRKDDMADAAVWRPRPIFITITFRDMHAERDYLRTRIFPELEERLRRRRHHLEPIDLRWGVETGTADNEQAKELLVLKVCLAEVERSRPLDRVAGGSLRLGAAGGPYGCGRAGGGLRRAGGQPEHDGFGDRIWCTGERRSALALLLLFSGATGV